jgi:hypothetical protein
MACLAGKEADEMTPIPSPGCEPFDPVHDSIEQVYGDLGAWPVEVIAKCCGKNPKARVCLSRIQECKKFFGPKYESKRDEIKDGDYSEDDKESLARVGRFWKKLCSSFEDEPDSCGSVPGNPLLASEIAAVVLACFLFVAIAGIVILVVLYLKKSGVGGASGTGGPDQADRCAYFS